MSMESLVANWIFYFKHRQNANWNDVHSPIWMWTSVYAKTNANPFNEPNRCALSSIFTKTNSPSKNEKKKSQNDPKQNVNVNKDWLSLEIYLLFDIQFLPFDWFYTFCPFCYLFASFSHHLFSQISNRRQDENGWQRKMVFAFMGTQSSFVCAFLFFVFIQILKNKNKNDGHSVA